MLKYLRLIIRVCSYLIINFWWIIKYSNHPKRYPLEKRYKKAQDMIHMLDRASKVDYIIEGREYVPTDDLYVLMPNHISFYDPLALVSIIDKHQSFVSKVETKKYPLVGRMVKSIDGVFLDRRDLKQELGVMRHVKNSLANKENSWVIFPEGTRTEDKNLTMGTFKAGAFKIAIDTETPIIPVAIFGTQRPLAYKVKYKRYPIHIKFLPPIMPEDTKNMKTAEVALMVENLVREAVAELKIKDAQYLQNLNIKKKKKRTS